MPEINPECSSAHINHYSLETSSFPVAWNSTHKLGWPISDPLVSWLPSSGTASSSYHVLLYKQNILKNKERKKKIQFWDLNHGPSAQKSLTIRGISTVPREVTLKSFTVFFFLKYRKPYTQAAWNSQPQSTPLPVACQRWRYSHQPV